MGEDALTIAGATMAWNAGDRMFLASYAPGARPRGPDARTMQEWMDARTGTAPFTMLVDLENADKVAIAWRFQWMSWFLAHRARLRVALIHTSAVDPITIKAFMLSTRTQIRSFASEGEARAWLLAPDEAAPAPERI